MFVGYLLLRFCRPCFDWRWNCFSFLSATGTPLAIYFPGVPL